jgi:hypothetical protein
MKKATCLPLAIGIAFGVLNFIATAANLVVPFSNDKYSTVTEVLTTLGSALGGPLGFLFSELGLDLSGYIYYVSKAYQYPQALYFQVGNFFAHLAAGMFIVFAYKFVYEKRLKTSLFIVMWVILVLIYYYAFLLPLQAIFFNIAIPGLNATYIDYIITYTPETIFTTVVSTLIMLALPLHYHKPLWYAAHNNAC